MSNRLESSDQPESLEQIEAMIAAAKDYIVPSDYLRPRVLDAARSQQSHMVGRRRLLQVAASVFLCVILTIPAQQRLEAWRQSAFSPSASELEIQALQYASKPTIGQNWGLYEAYKSLRHDQMIKITGPSTR